jgi:hypothetical protein
LRANHRPVPRSSRGNLLKSVHRKPMVRFIDREVCADAQAG